MTRLIFADVETTGTDPTRHSLWEIALIGRDPDWDGDREYAWQVGVDRSVADPMALKVGRYYRRCKVYGASPETAWVLANPDDPDSERKSHDHVAELVADPIATLLDGAVLAAANVAFDAAFIGKFLRANGHCPTWDYHLLEIESYAAGALGVEPPWKLDKLATQLGLALPEERHSALADARLVRDVYDAARITAGARRAIVSAAGGAS